MKNIVTEKGEWKVEVVDGVPELKKVRFYAPAGFHKLAFSVLTEMEPGDTIYLPFFLENDVKVCRKYGETSPDITLLSALDISSLNQVNKHQLRLPMFREDAHQHFYYPGAPKQ